MKLLAVDTSTLACSAALSIDGAITERHAFEEREHTRILVPMISELLADKNQSLQQLDAIVLGNGPGSFIGMRIAASLVQGMAFASGRPVVPVSSLLAVAEAVFAERDCDEVLVAQDAHMQEVYLGRFARDDAGVVATVAPEVLHPQTQIGALEPGLDRLAAGEGWLRYPALFEANEAAISERVEPLYPTARFLLPAAMRSVERGEVIDPAEVEPSYLRHEVAVRPATS